MSVEGDGSLERLAQDVSRMELNADIQAQMEKFLRTRKAHMGHLTRLLNELSESMNTGAEEKLIQDLCRKTEEYFGKLCDCTDELISFCEKSEKTDNIKEAEQYIMKVKEKVSKELESAANYLIKLQAQNQTLDQRSQISVASSSASLRVAAAVAKAKKAAIDKRNEFEEEKERLRREEEEALRKVKDSFRSKQQRIDRLADSAALAAEENTLLLCAQEEEMRERAIDDGSRRYGVDPLVVRKEDCDPPPANKELIQLLELMQLPQVSVAEFNGDPMQYFSFIKSFQELVGRTSVTAQSKLARLLKLCTGPAYKAISSCNLMAPEIGYSTALAKLEKKFGDKIKIRELWTETITKGKKVKSYEDLKSLAEDVTNCAANLSAMGFDIGSFYEKACLVIARLPVNLQNKWRTAVVKFKKSHGNEYPSLDFLGELLEDWTNEYTDPMLKLLTEESQKLKGRDGSKICFSTEAEESEPKVKEEGGDQLRARSCVKCSGSHNLHQCKEFLQMKDEERLNFVQSKSLCFNCLRPNHFVNKCYRNKMCDIEGCLDWHSKFLHEAFRKLESNSYLCGIEDQMEKIILPLTKAKVVQNDQKLDILVLIDPGSNKTYCDKNLVQKLGIKGECTLLNLKTLNGIRKRSTEKVELQLLSGIKNKKKIVLNDVYTLDDFPDLQNCVPTKEEVGKWEHLKDIDVSDFSKLKVSMVIGLNNSHCVIPLEVKKNELHEPYAVRTILGWTINGPIGNSTVNDCVSNFIHTTEVLRDEISEKIERLWRTEDHANLFNSKLAMSREDISVLELWDATVTKEDGHYQLPIPFKTSPLNIENNLPMVEQRLKSLKRKLTRDPVLKMKYQAEIDRLNLEGYAEIVPKEELKGKFGSINYLPIFNVSHPHKPEKFRLIHDCKAEYKGNSLNKLVKSGPDLCNSLVGVITRFREHRIAVISDIRSMFFQVKVSKEHRDCLRFLWWPQGNLNEDPVVMRMTVHLFGGVWSPAAAMYAVRRTADDQVNEFSDKTIVAVKQNMYIDNLFHGGETVSEVIEFQAEVYDLMLTGGFELNEWNSNSDVVMKQIPDHLKSKVRTKINIGDNESLVESALGLQWDTNRDELMIRVNIKVDIPSTKRGMLSFLCSLFDPIGMINPVIVVAKKLFQDSCRIKIGWDEKLPEDIYNQWWSWFIDLSHLKEYRISRCMKPVEGEIEAYEVHIFCDSSEVAYCAVSYLRIVMKDQSIHTAFLMAKSRLLPMQGMPMPRAELCGATVGVKLKDSLNEELNLKVSSFTFWCDSMIVINSIKNETKRFKTFVANRLNLIHSSSTPNQWRYVPSETNIADHLSRGMKASVLVKSEEWLRGPAFLSQPEDQWSTEPSPKSDESDTFDTTKSFLAESHEQEDHFSNFISYFSSWDKLVVSLCWMKKFVDWLRAKKNTSAIQKDISVDDLQYVEKKIITYTQNLHFKEEISKLRGNLPVKRSSPISRMDPVLDSEGVLRVGGRLMHSAVHREVNCQVIIPKEHHIAPLLIQKYHDRTGHSGNEYTLSKLREKYWIPGARTVIRKLIRHCVWCNKYRRNLCTQKMADLPDERLMANTPAFTNVGLDCFGPIMVKRGRTQEKRWGCLFTCLVTRAVHLEKLNSLDTSSFLNALTRFMSRRGVPENIRSDNGTNFTGAVKELKLAFKELQTCKRTRNQLLQNRTTWTFNPPYASHMGGIWERCIRTVKKVLNVTVHKQVLDDEKLDTFLCEVESIVNNRPITYCSSDANDMEPLTPNHLLLLRKGNDAIMTKTTKEDRYCKRWRNVQYLADKFWRSWIRQYLPLIQIRSKWHDEKNNLKVGDLVMIADLIQSRNQWPMAKVIEVFEGRDGLVRSVKLKTSNSELTRPIAKLCLLEGVVK